MAASARHLAVDRHAFVVERYRPSSTLETLIGLPGGTTGRGNPFGRFQSKSAAIKLTMQANPIMRRLSKDRPRF
jgi:hypothetical protein